MDPFVSVDWLADHRDAPDLRIVDVRDAWEFDAIGHVPGAVSVPFETFRSEDGDEGMLPGEAVWVDLLSAAGIDATDRIVAYDDTHGVFAARFGVTALLYGHEAVAVLDGDYSAWSREQPTTTDAAESTTTDYAVDRPAPEATPLIGFDAVRAALSDPETVVLDTRERWEYEEGHLPGALQLDWETLVDSESRGLRSAREVETVLADLGIDRDTSVVLYCNTARRISHTYTVLRHLGYDDVAFYEGSLTEWKDRDGDLVAGSDPR